MITTSDIEDVLVEFNATQRHEVKYAIEFYIPAINQYVYINKQAGQKPTGLVIHPNSKIRNSELTLREGVIGNATLLHKASMRKFPKRLNRGVKPIPFGIPFGFESKNALREFIKRLSEIHPSYSQEPEQKI